MFEGNLAPLIRDGATGKASLRPLDWSALVTQIAAARDLRGALGRVNGGRGGSFARLAQATAGDVNASERTINQGGLADRKAIGGIIAPVADAAAGIDREIQ